MVFLSSSNYFGLFILLPSIYIKSAVSKVSQNLNCLRYQPSCCEDLVDKSEQAKIEVDVELQLVTLIYSWEASLTSLPLLGWEGQLCLTDC